MRHFGNDATANETRRITDRHYQYREMTTRSAHHIVSLAENIPAISGADRERPGSGKRHTSKRRPEGRRQWPGGGDKLVRAVVGRFRTESPTSRAGNQRMPSRRATPATVVSPPANRTTT